MSTDPAERRSDADAELEREIRAERKFTLAEAIARMAGPGITKGVSLVSRKQQAESEIQVYLERHLTDTTGTLPGVLFRQVRNSALLLENPEHPLVVLSDYVRGVLGSEYLLKELVREADVEWGRALGERPYFQNEGSPPHPDDPYTAESVRISLSRLLEKLNAGDA